MITKFNEFITESVNFQKTKDWLSNVIMNTKGLVRMKRMKEKYIRFLDKLE